MQCHMIKTASAVPLLKVAEPAYNAQEIIAMMEKYADCGVLVFPELSISAYTCADLFQHTVLLEECLQAVIAVKEASNAYRGLLTVVGMPFVVKDKTYNCAVFINEGKILGIVPKTYIPMYGEFYEGRWFTSGNACSKTSVVIDGDEVPFGSDLLFRDSSSHACVAAEICEDVWVPEAVSTKACLAGANIIVNLSASDEAIGKKEYREQMLKQQSSACYCAYVYASSGTCESSTDMVFSGHHMILDCGKVMAEGIFETLPAGHSAIVDLDRIAFDRRHQNTFCTYEEYTFRTIEAHIKQLCDVDTSVTALHNLFVKENYQVSAFPFVPYDDAERGRRCRTILAIQANGLASRVRASGIHKLVIGISGGLDSTLAILVCHEAKKIVPEIEILAITMPNEGNTTSLTYDNALSLMDILADEKREIPIGKGVNDHLEVIGHGAEYRGAGDTAYENAQARMRTYILMDIANMENGLVVGTGDLSELALGWCTYNGDHMSMYGVNASVPKTLVQYICRSYADTCGDERLQKTLHSICDTPITPELTPSSNGQIAQKTEDAIGKYDLNDFFLFYTLRYGMEPEKLMALAMKAFDITLEHTAKSLQNFYTRFFHQQFKRNCLPDGPKVGSVTFSPRGDWRMPSDASCKSWIDRVKNAE